MKITWLGHSAFRVDLGTSHILIDPFLTGNPKFTGSLDEAAAGITHVVLTHGHDDHIGDTVEIVRKTGAEVVANFEICMFLGGQGVENINPGNTGGVIPCGDFSVALTPALHSSGAVVDGRSIYLGNPNGVVLLPEDGPPVYHFGDTAIFGDMELIREIYQPEIGLIPVGDRFTMDGRAAALAAKRYFSFSDVIPCHYGTFPIIDPTPQAFLDAMQGTATKIHVPSIGEALLF
ncbi:metal-dependent hydrolase [Rhodoblastus sp.]|jgi:L-ascorbate metabolism protein UlaG (beta-lactamase superfamily)|uniref:metal-dependent hydrolase n=1 Tax=Rhodoblastus sp. TaxID=1962975 RepID=UPI0025E95D93|nr:metal-dependent hydrolase [Rhodoblastus sp.]